MARLGDPLKIAADALRHVGEYGRWDDGPEASALDVALNALSANVAQLGGSYELFWLSDTYLRIPMVATKQTYIPDEDRTDASKDDLAANFVIDAWLIDDTTHRAEIKIWTEREWLERDQENESGPPEAVYIQRHPEMKLFVWPTPAETDVHTLEVTVQTLSPEFTTDCKSPDGESLPAVWHRWGAYATAYDIGDGPIADLDSRKLQRFERKAAIALKNLLVMQRPNYTSKGRIQFRNLG